MTEPAIGQERRGPPGNGGAAASGEGWVTYAKCADLPRTTFFPRERVGVMVAKHVCANCPVRGQCLAFALANRIASGVWGGASEQERRRILRRGARRTPF